MDLLKELRANYFKLCAYCDAFFKNTQNRHDDEMQCGAGCCSCCILESVTPLEAWIIRDYLQENEVKANRGNNGRCIFLNDCRCGIYEVRPLICRTHGLLLRSGEDGSVTGTCPLNFRNAEMDEIDKKYVLDIGLITDNLIRLDLAYRKITGGEETLPDRIKLSELIS
ncbi:MAG: YkgJ family cysteine cluster protein [Calditrichia bacterium]